MERKEEADMAKGFIKIDRNLLNWRWKNIPEMVALWVEILLQANFEGREYGTDFFEKGSFPTSIDKLSKSTGLSSRTIRTCLKRLEQTGEIIVKSTNHGTKINVINWAQYQGVTRQSDKQVTSNRQASDNSIRKKEGKKERNIYNRPKFIEDLEIYDTSNNPVFTKEKREELRKRRRS